MRGYDKLTGRVQDLARHPGLPSTEREELTELPDYHRAETAACGAVHDYLEAAAGHVETYKELERETRERSMRVGEFVGWPE